MSLTLYQLAARIHDRLSLQVNLHLQQPITALFGPSGAGKTSLLEVICGLRKANAGQIQLDKTILFDSSKKINLSPAERNIGYVPQDLALFPHLSVKQNIFFSRNPKKIASAPLLELLQLNSLLHRKIHALSGGEKQRVALARALISSPHLLILDEPLANLDYALKNKIIMLLKQLTHEFHLPILYVSHSLEEVSQLCDEVVRMENGQCSNPMSVTELKQALAVERDQTVDKLD
jgi:molybdate transport system ATP-binding protein